MAEDVKKGTLSPEDISGGYHFRLSGYQRTAGSGSADPYQREERLSNFLMWQLAYTEFYFTDVAWPDFDKAEFVKAMKNTIRETADTAV